MCTLSDLTLNQREAVEHDEGPLLVLAGPGSGKTRVITHRIARLLDRGIGHGNILGLTFTNKAATEMATRVGEMRPRSRVWVSTFHRFCARLLRQRSEVVGLHSNFSIFDTTDQRQLIRDTLHDLGFDTVHYSVDKIRARISRAKNQMQSAAAFAKKYQQAIGDHLQAVTAEVYTEYQRRLLKSNAVDFDDLLFHVVTLLIENPEVRCELDARFRYILVDEYQDTNLAQYKIVAALCHDVPNVCVTGDPDQSIYGWRGAQIDNILRFETDFPGAKTVRLEQNFRSTLLILQSADRLISHNRYRKTKTLLTDQHAGTPVELACFHDGHHEADFIARSIRQHVESSNAKWSDFAVFYRVNSLSREIELAMLRYRVPFQVAAGIAFYERAEVKDLLAYLRLVENPRDHAAFLRVVNKPLRGIGKITRDRLVKWAETKDESLWEAARHAKESSTFSTRAAKRLTAFAELLDSFCLADAGSIAQLLRRVIDRTGYTRGWEDSTAERDTERLAVVRELVETAAQYEAIFQEDASLEGFLESSSLCSDVDGLDQSAGKVTLMTLHAAKGLEFPVVFIVAVEQNLIPHERALKSENPRELEEERRLLFVGMTRAMRQLFLTKTKKRTIHGRCLDAIPSPFLSELQYQLRDYTADAADNRTVSSTDASKRVRDSAQVVPSLRAKRPLLTTAAALLKGDPKEVTLPQGFAVGTRVRHPTYGLGTVVNIGGYARQRTLTVGFADSGRQETFVANKCPLQPIGLR